MSALPKLNSYRLIYEQIPLHKHKVAASKQKPGRRPGVPQLPRNILDNV